MRQESRNLARRRKHKKFTLMTSLVILLLVLAGVGAGVAVYHNNEVKKAQVIAYKKLKTSVKSAETTAFNSPTDKNVAQMKTLVAKLDKKDKVPYQKSLATLEGYVDHIDQAKNALKTYKKSKNDADYTAVTNKINLLTSKSEAAQKNELNTTLATVKKEVDAEKAAAEKAKYEGKKLIALTFDDGPNPTTTPKLLKTLADNDVKATFFPLGEEAKANPDIIKAEAAQGHEVASHTWDHKNLVTLTPEQQKQEILSAHDLINSLTGQKTNFFRPPYGSYNATTLAQTPLAAVDWSIDTNDWRYVNNTPMVIQNAVNYAHDGGIILIHDIHSWSINAVPDIIQQLKAKGYTFVTVSELLNAKEGPIQSGKVYTGY
ncbi:polysaccharide deacetylase family protein [Lactococcus hircilactis]|nr:polysaccharide deacetylase family protein [Lactococcus hircilactis]